VRKLFGLLLGLILISSCAASSLAQDKQDTTKSKTKTVTGCISKGDNPGEYKLAAKDGSTWELRSNETDTKSSNESAGKTALSVNLAQHVGHTVTATGVVAHAKMEMPEAGKQEATQGGMKKHDHGGEPRELKVIAIKHISDSCS